MTSQELIIEGRRLARPAFLLTVAGPGEISCAVWHEIDFEEITETGYRKWITVETKFFTFLDGCGTYITASSDEEECVGGRVESSCVPPHRPGLDLAVRRVDILPPIEGIFSLGGANVESWLHQLGWDRRDRFNSNFPDAGVVDGYLSEWRLSWPFFNPDVYAVLGGWHQTWPNPDWHERLDHELILYTLKDAAPWVEVWRLPSGEFELVRRII